MISPLTSPVARHAGRLVLRGIRRAAGALLLALGLAGCAAHWANTQAREQLAGGRYEDALQALDEAIRQHPGDVELRSTWLRARAEAVTRLVAAASTARAAAQFDDAEALLRRAAKLDPDSARLRDLIQAVAIERRQAAALAEAAALADKGQAAQAQRIVAEALKPNPRHPELVALQRRLELAQRQALLVAARGGLAEARPISLDFRDAGLRTVLDLVSRHSGVSFVLDKDIRADLRVTVYLRNVRVEEALDLIVSTHQLAKKVLDERTVLIYPNVPEKQREYQEQVVRVFYLASADAKQAASFLRAMLKIRDPFVDERSNMLALREPPETIQLAERLLMLYDTGEPEVTLELEVLEVSSTRLTELGVKFPDTLALTPLAAAGATGHTVSSLRGINSDRIGVTVSGLLLSLRREVGDFQTLANPRVRIKNREKAKVLVGSKVPVVTTTATTGFIAESVNYLDVGLKLELEPTVAADDDVTIKVALEVSTLSNQVKTSTGTLAYEIGTRNASTVLRLRDGETQVLAGLVSREERSSASRVPGLGDVPVLGRLFSSQLDNGTRTELVLAITPRVVRNLRRPDTSESELWVGTDSHTRLRPPGGRAALQPDSEPKGSQPAPAAGQPGAPASAAGAAGSATGAAAQPADAATWALQWNAPASVKPGEEFTAELQAKGTVPVRGMNLRVTVKPEQATLLRGAPGAWWSSDKADVSVSQATDPATGQWQLGVIRRVAEGVTGAGTIATLRLKAGAAGRIEWPLAHLEAIAGGPQVPRPGMLPVLRVEVQP